MNNGNEVSFERSLQTTEIYGKKVSSLFVNTDKTQVIRSGSKRRLRIKYTPHLKGAWNPSYFKILGV